MSYKVIKLEGGHAIQFNAPEAEEDALESLLREYIPIDPECAECGGTGTYIGLVQAEPCSVCIPKPGPEVLKAYFCRRK